MHKSNRYLLKGSLFCFLTLVVMNSIKFIEIIELIGSIGKLIFCLLFILIVVVRAKKGNIKLKLLHKKAYLAISLILIFSSIIFFVISGVSDYLLINLAFPIYFLFFYLILKLFIKINFAQAGPNFLEVTKLDILRVYRFTIFFNLVLWFSVAFVKNINMIGEDGDFGGFFQSEIQLGLYAVTGFLVSFYLRFNQFHKDKSVLNYSLIIVYLGISLFASRNALLIVSISTIYFFLISNLKNKLYIILLLLLPLFIVNIDLISHGLSLDKINEFTSGRLEIWRLAMIKIMENGLLLGRGLFNLNDIVLRDNLGTGFYYLDSIQFLSFHSSYVELLAGGGLLVLVVFIRIIMGTWNRLKIIDKSIIAGILIGAFFESFLVQPFTLIATLFYFVLFSNSFLIKVKRVNIDLKKHSSLSFS